MLIGYFGEHAHKPKIMASGVFLMCIGSLLFALPHFIGDVYHYTLSDGSTNQTVNLCSNTSSSICSENAIDESAYTGYYVMFILGQMLLGIGAVPMFTIALTYIDENCKQKMTSFYVSLTFCAAAVGVAVGYIVGGQSLTLFVDIDKVDASSVPLTPMDPQWTGAWWIGIIITFAAFIIISIPLLGYPKRLPGYKKLQKLRKSEVHASVLEELPPQPNFGKSIKDFPRAVLLLVRNPAYSFIVLAATIELLVIGGLATFGAKILTIIFNVDLTEAGSVMGIITIPGSGGGMLVGGYLVKRFNMDCRGIIRLCFVCMAICLLFAPAFLANCPSQPMAGVSTPYMDQQSLDLTSSCNKDCHCSTTGYEPICDTRNGRVYFTPCHAGCTNVTKINDRKVYYDCPCIQNTNSSLPNLDPDAISGSCSGKCTWFYVFCVLLFFVMFFTFMTMSPVVTAIFRCVPHEQRSLAIGSQLLIGRLLGTTPGPVFLGTIIDSTCEVWQDTCGVSGSCWIFRKEELGLRIMIWWLALKTCGVIFFILAYKLYKPPKDAELDKYQEESNTLKTRNEITSKL
ncbi:hypothetical protein FSP39_002395 [Pinctada imbricata]|uniref:Solute carrier organic anion transporter family member n=1 Tax=Pinctada imbricata TaxID=66713 RepID=A0AA88XUP5_PINIB|nr:hypothetical protein FSP39_002395 [Pinctada imbricata]